MTSDFLVSVACLPDGFNYLDSVFTMIGRDITFTVPAGESVPLPWSTSVADGSYTTGRTFMAPTNSVFRSLNLS
jgi:hypothetical protein